MVNSVQYLRIFAALGVAFFHAGPYAYADYSPEKEAQFWFSAARIGVDIFFIISGFVMYVTEHGNEGGGLHGSHLFSQNCIFFQRACRIPKLHRCAPASDI